MIHTTQFKYQCNLNFNIISIFCEIHQRTVKEDDGSKERKKKRFYFFFRNLQLFSFIPESLAQELEIERKSRQQQAERDVKSPLQDRPNYYKNSVLFTSTAT